MSRTGDKRYVESYIKDERIRDVMKRIKKKMKTILHLMRCKHYIKNLLLFIPLFFEKDLFDLVKIRDVAIGFLSFSMASSFIYIVNDINDVERDRHHPTKCKRPLASGEVSITCACLMAAGCLFLSVVLGVMPTVNWHYMLIVCYIILNILYSKKLKNIPLIDVAVLVSGFVIRIAYGGLVSSVSVSAWLYMTIIAGAFYLGLGKRRNELKYYKNRKTRAVMEYYNYEFLDKNMYMCMGLCNTFYALWAMNQADFWLMCTVPVVLLISMKYSLLVEGGGDGDPVEVILKDRFILTLGMICIFILLIALYGK